MPFGFFKKNILLVIKMLPYIDFLYCQLINFSLEM